MSDALLSPGRDVPAQWLDLLCNYAASLDKEALLDFENAGLYLGDGYFAVLLWTPPLPEGGGDLPLASQWEARRTALSALIDKKLRRKFLHHTGVYGSGVLSLVCFPDTGLDSTAAQNDLERAAAEILRESEGAVCPGITAVLSCVQPGRAGIETAYSSALDMWHYTRFLQNPPQLIAQKIMRPADLNWEENYLFRSTITHLVDALYALDEQSAMRQGEEFLHYIFVNPPYGLYYLRLRIEIFLNHLLTELVERDMVHSEFLEDINPVFGLTDSRTEAVFRQLFFDYLQRVLDCYSAKTQNPILKKMTDIKNYIDTHYTDVNLTAGDLASRFHIAQGTLSYHFKKYRDCSPSEYILRIRTAAARHRITTTDETMEAIAQAVGFGSYISMQRAFKKLYNAAPGQFR